MAKRETVWLEKVRQEKNIPGIQSHKRGKWAFHSFSKVVTLEGRTGPNPAGSRESRGRTTYFLGRGVPSRAERGFSAAGRCIREEKG